MRRASSAGSDWRVWVLAGVAHFSAHFFELMYPTLAVSLAREVHLPLQQVLGWSFFGYLLFGFGALPAGLLADRFGARVLLIAGMGGTGVAAIAASGVAGGTPLVICLACLGLAASVHHPAAMSLISRTGAARGPASRVNAISAGLGFAIAPIATAVLCERYTWQGAYGLAGFAMSAVAIACGFLPIAERSPADARDELPAEPAGGGLVSFGLLCIAIALAGFAYRGITLIQPGYFADSARGIDFAAATSLVCAFALAGQYAAAALAERRDLRRLYLAFNAASLPALLAMATAAGAPLVAASAVFVFFAFGAQPLESELFGRFVPARWRSTAHGIKFALTFGVGALAVRLVDHAEPARDLAAVLLALCAAVAVIGAFIATGGATVSKRERSLEPDALAQAPPAV
jgi:MFS transporter, FSR family, fosmidomycin resistance protein